MWGVDRGSVPGKAAGCSIVGAETSVALSVRARTAGRAGEYRGRLEVFPWA